MTKKFVGKKRYWKMASRCTLCGQYHSTYAAELLANKCANCGTSLPKPAQYELGYNIVTVSDVKIGGKIRVRKSRTKYVLVNSRTRRGVE